MFRKLGLVKVCECENFVDSSTKGFESFQMKVSPLDTSFVACTTQPLFLFEWLVAFKFFNDCDGGIDFFVILKFGCDELIQSLMKSTTNRERVS